MYARNDRSHSREFVCIDYVVVSRSIVTRIASYCSTRWQFVLTRTCIGRPRYTSRELAPDDRYCSRELVFTDRAKLHHLVGIVMRQLYM